MDARTRESRIEKVNDFIDAVIGLGLYVYPKGSLPRIFEKAIGRAKRDQRLLEEGKELEAGPFYPSREHGNTLDIRDCLADCKTEKDK